MKKILLPVVCIFICAAGAYAQSKTLKKLHVTVDAAEYGRTDAVASLDLTPYTLGGKTVVVRELTPDGTKPCVIQIDERDGVRTLWWRVDGQMAPGSTRSFEVTTVAAAGATVAAPAAVPAVSGTASATADARATVMGIERGGDGTLTLVRNGSPILAYHTKMSRPGHGVDPVFSRDGYIHPAWSPAGSVLTEFAPADHSHHYGIWSAWTSANFEGARYDMWNVIQKQGRVQLDSVLAMRSGDLFADLLVSHDHIIFQPQAERTYSGVDEVVKITPKKRITIIDERLDLRAWNAGEKIFVWDFDSELTPAAGQPIVMTPYRYGGFVWRATRDFRAENLRMLSSEGLERDAIDGTKARWLLVSGSTDKGRCGFLMMSHPQNPVHPEPLRTWDAKQNRGRGDLMANFAPAKFEPWTLEPGRQYRLRYRVATFDGDLSAAEAERLWQEFAHPVKVSVK